MSSGMNRACYPHPWSFCNAGQEKQGRDSLEHQDLISPRAPPLRRARNTGPSSAAAARCGPVEEVERDRGEERRNAQVVVGQAGKHRERVPALRSALAHPTAVAEAAVEKLEGLDVMAGWRHVGIGADDHRRHLKATHLL